MWHQQEKRIQEKNLNGKILLAKGLAAWPKKNVKLPKIYDKKALIYKSLEVIGYNVKDNLNASIIAFKRHFIPCKLDHLVDEEEMRMLITVSKYFMAYAQNFLNFLKNLCLI